MPRILSLYATPLITGLFVVSLVSGVALFFHLGSAWFHSMHEWLSIVLILPFVLHIWKNWRSFVNYFKRPAMAVASVASLAAAVAFVVPVITADGSAARSGPPEFAAVRAMQNAPISTVATLYGQDGNGLAERLRERGYTVVSTDMSLNAVAAASGKSPREILVDLPSVGE